MSRDLNEETVSTRKNVFITLPEVLIARNLFDTEFWPTLKQKLAAWNIFILVPSAREEFYTKRFKGEGVTIIGIAPKESGMLSRILNVLALNAINTSTNRWEKMRAYTDGRSSRLATFGKRIYTAILGASTIYKRSLRHLLLLPAPDAVLSELFERIQPDAVVLTSLTNYDFDVLVGKEARRRNISIMGMPRSWDNFTSHGLIRVIPETLFVQNEFLRDSAVTHQAVDTSSAQVKVFGVPHYDVCKDASTQVISRDELFSRVGLDTDKKFILYGAMGDYLFRHEGEVVPTLESILGNIGGAQTLFRAHPHFASPLESMGSCENILPDRFAVRIDRTSTDQDLDLLQSQHLLSSLYWSDVIVTSASTFAIDGVVMGKPVICIAYDMGKDVPYWYSNKRFYDQYTHFEALIATGGVMVVRSDAELEAALRAALTGKGPSEEAHQRLLDLFVEPFDGKAGVRLAGWVADAVINRSVE